ncbi:hypothetical protein [uncultured Mailhella sp.]|uniref:hypothetical protein n=1 Tax=uncultured Mailhella sp. TaxID=1981031 RepID=UPI0026024890|nr:hypothetical protein [uncultured Mailhella sp.]
MRRRKKTPPAAYAETADWLKKAVHSAPRPLPAGFFPRILEHAEAEGFERGTLLDVLDEWLNYGYCRITDSIAQDIEITPEGGRFFYRNL